MVGLRSSVLALRKLVRLQVIWLLLAPVSAAGIGVGERQATEAPVFGKLSETRLLAVRADGDGSAALDRQPGYFQYTQPQPVTLAQGRAPFFRPAYEPRSRIGVFGTERKFELRKPNSDAKVTYNISTTPPITVLVGRTNPRHELKFPAATPPGVYTVTVEYANGTPPPLVHTFIYRQFDKLALTDWKLIDGKPAFRFDGEAVCFPRADLFPGDSRTGNNGAYSKFLWRFRYNNQSEVGTSRLHMITGTGGDVVKCNDPAHVYSQRMAIGNGGASAKVDIDANTGWFGIEVDSALAQGTHNYKIKFQIAGNSPHLTGFPAATYYTSPIFDITYILSSAAVTVKEVTTPTAAPGHSLGTVGLGQDLVSVVWTVEDSGISVNIMPISGSGNRRAKVVLAAATALDFEAGRNFTTLTISAAGRSSETQAFFEYIVLKIELSDDPNEVAPVNASPEFVASSLAATREENAEGGLTAVGTVVGTVQATDADNDAITYSILSGADGNLFGIGGSTGIISLVMATDFDHDSSKNVYTISVRASDGTANTDGRFVLSITEGSDSISADDSALAVLRADSRSGTIPVQLSAQPAGGQNVTLSVTSATPAELTAAPAHLVFTPSDWSTAQTVTMGLTDAAVAAKGTSKGIDVVFSVHDAGNSASNYQGVDAVTVSVSINIVNVAPKFDAGSLEGTIEENAEGYDAEGIEIETAVGDGGGDRAGDGCKQGRHNLQHSQQSSTGFLFGDRQQHRGDQFERWQKTLITMAARICTL